MKRWFRTILALFSIVTLCSVASAEPSPTPSPLPLPPAHLVYPVAADQLPAPVDAPGSELTERGRDVRGVYLPYPKLRSWDRGRIARWVKAVGADAVIIDMKDDRGRVTFSRELPTALGRPHGQVKDMGALVSKLKGAGIYVIGRVVCFKDNLFAINNPAQAIRDRRKDKLWKDNGGLAWADPYSDAARAHIVEVAKAAAALGVDEIQLDYVRFPVEPDARFAEFPNMDEPKERYEVIAELLSRVDRAIDLPLSIDVFGLTAYHPGDRDGLGQSLEHLAPYIDAISPMVYLANWPKRYWENPRPKKTHELVNGAVREIRRRLGDDIAVRPLLQAFRWRAKNFGTGFIENQIDAAVTGGSSGYLFWNQNGRYYKVSAVWRRLDRKNPRPEPSAHDRTVVAQSDR